MELFVCEVCGHIEFDSAPDTCPVCWSPGNKFRSDPDIIKKPADPENLSEGEKKHIPVLLIKKECGLLGEGCVDVHAKIGEITHVMEKEHYIKNLDFYLDRKFVGQAFLQPESVNPAGCVHLKASGSKITVIEHCNVHGYWMTEEEI